MSAVIQDAIIITGASTFDEAVAALSIHFGGEAVNLSTGEIAPLRDASAVFTGSSQLSVSTGADMNTTEPSVELDINGLPWDERIHSSSKNKNTDGSWRGRKGVPPPTIAKVKAELLSKRPAAASLPTTAQQNLQNNDEAARAARIAYAEEQAFITVGPKNCTDDEFNKLKRGQMVTVAKYVEEWFDRWQSAFNNAYKTYADNTLQGTQTAHVGLQAINPAAGTNQPVQTSVATETAREAAEVFTQQAAAPAAATGPDVNTFPGFAVKYAAHAASPVLGEVLATLGITGGFAALAAQEPMIPAVIALLTAKGIA